MKNENDQWNRPPDHDHEGVYLISNNNEYEKNRNIINNAIYV